MVFWRKSAETPFHRCGELASLWPALCEWYRSPVGERLAQREKELLDQSLVDLFGYYLVQFGRVSQDDWLSSSRVSHCTVMDYAPQPDPALTGTHRFHGLPDALPLQTDSIDVAVLPHILEFSLNPHQVLREVERILIPEGHVVMLTFSPWSMWSLWRWSVGWRKEVPWCGRFLSTTRLRDWLALLGFDVVKTQNYFYRPPIRHHGVMNKLAWCESLGGRVWPILGASTLIVARKRVVTLTPIRPRWKTQRKQVVAGLAEPTNRFPQQHREQKKYERMG